MSIVKQWLADRLEAFLRKRYKGKDLEQVVWLTRMVALHSPEKLCERHGDVNLWKLLPQDKSLFTCGEGLGMAIGNLTSQEYANFYLSPFDHFVKAHPGIAYLRYVDDARLFSHDKAALLAIIPEIRKYLREHDGLRLHPRKINLQQVRKGFSFVGVAIKGGRIYTGNRTTGNCWQMIEFYNRLPIEEQQESVTKYVQRYNSYMGYMIHHSSYSIRYRAWEHMGEMKRFVYAEKQLGMITPLIQYNQYQQLKQSYYDLRKHSGSGLQSCRTKQAA